MKKCIAFILFIFMTANLSFVSNAAQNSTITSKGSAYVGLSGKTIAEYDGYLIRAGFSENSLMLIDGVILALDLNNPDISREEKIKAVHDYIMLSVSYKLDHYSIDKILTTGYAQCQGYADLFYVFMTELGIPCHNVVGNVTTSTGVVDLHAWNAVMLEDGDWYFVDATWDDLGDNKFSYDYFLVTADIISVNHTITRSYQDYHIKSIEDFAPLGTIDYRTKRMIESFSQVYGVQAEDQYYVSSIEDAKKVGMDAGSKNKKTIIIYFPEDFTNYCTIKDSYFEAVVDMYHEINPSMCGADGLYGSRRFYYISFRHW